ncbi:MAG: TlpA family protein disulfide reductase [Acidobacteria bacterium]|nr:TlpA family protein disulfide reductase [Acidobacteriota bacterium]
MKKAVIGVVALAALGVGGFMAVRYTRQGGRELSDSKRSAAKTKIQFVNDPVAVPELTLKTLDGRTLSSKDWKGRVTLVNFWATWCPPCRAEIPDLIRLQERYKDQLQIIGVSADEGSPAEVAKFAAEHRMNYAVVMETPELTKAFPGIFALPTTFVIDQDVKIVQKHVGLMNPTLMEQEIRVLAKLPIDVEVERVPDNGQVLLSNAAQATDVPGIELDKLAPGQRTAALKRLNDEQCTCGCGLTLAQCRINDPSCDVSLPIAKEIVVQVASAGK